MPPTTDQGRTPRTLANARSSHQMASESTTGIGPPARCPITTFREVQLELLQIPSERQAVQRQPNDTSLQRVFTYVQARACVRLRTIKLRIIFRFKGGPHSESSARTNMFHARRIKFKLLHSALEQQRHSEHVAAVRVSARKTSIAATSEVTESLPLRLTEGGTRRRQRRSRWGRPRCPSAARPARSRASDRRAPRHAAATRPHYRRARGSHPW